MSRPRPAAAAVVVLVLTLCLGCEVRARGKQREGGLDCGIANRPIPRRHRPPIPTPPPPHTQAYRVRTTRTLQQEAAPETTAMGDGSGDAAPLPPRVAAALGGYLDNKELVRGRERER